ncbi:MAG: flavoredoxin [Planctomycetes bacterium]|nr:flavoredoxin [Planctomycetota bacterium]
MADPIPDEAYVVRGGQNRPADLRRKIGTHPSGVTGLSVECDVGMTIEELAVFVPHGQFGVTTVGEIRAAGGDVIRTTGKSPHHATLVGLSADEASRLLNPTQANPAKKP